MGCADYSTDVVFSCAFSFGLRKTMEFILFSGIVTGLAALTKTNALPLYFLSALPDSEENGGFTPLVHSRNTVAADLGGA